MKPWIPSTKSTATPPSNGPGKFPRSIHHQTPYAPSASGEEAADEAERDADPLDRLGPEAREDVEREPRQAKGRVARSPLARSVADVDLDDARSAGEDQRLRELLLADRAEHRLDDVAPVRVERAAEVRDVDAA